jgi:anti-sigma factor RsiW
MSSESDIRTCADEAALLLPWYVNGTLSADEVRHVEAHLLRCETCRAELAEQRQWRELMRGLRARLDAVQAATGGQPTPERGAPAPPARPRHRVNTWLAAAVVVQAVALGWLATMALPGGRASGLEPRYRTLTSTAPPHGAQFRVVFTPKTTLAELEELLRANRLAGVAGPSEAGLFTLALPADTRSDEARRAVLARLRADPRVLFAEPRNADGR